MERDRMRKRIMRWVIDKSILIILSVIVMGALVTLIFIMKSYAHMPDGWLFFILFCVLYVVMVSYACFPMIRKKRRKILLFSLLYGLQAFGIILIFILFYFNLIKLPEKGIIIYGVAFTGLAILSSVIYSILIKKVK
jgi:hypothetical protein